MADPRLHDHLAALIVDATDDAVIGATAEGTVARWNPGAERLFGWTSAEAAGRRITDLFPKDREKEAGTLLDRARRGEHFRLETTLQRRNGIPVEVSLAVSPVAPGGKVTGVALIARDVSDRRALEKKIHEGQLLESLGLLAGGIAHDFNNLLTVVMGNASIAKAQVAKGSKLWDYLEDIEVTSQRAADLASQMLSYSGRGVFVLQRVDLNALVHEISELIRVSLPKGVRLKYELAPVLPKVEADPTQLRQVVMNLVINAAQAIGEREGSVTIGTRLARADRDFLGGTRLSPDLEPGEFVWLSVSDTGSGMDAATLERIFDPFFTTKSTGRGLGLSAVLGIVRGHKAGIRVDSVAGRGTTFTVLFPSGGSLAPRPRTPGPSEESWRGAGTVLVVDDEPKLRDFARGALEFLGFRALTAGDGLEAIEVMKKHASEITAVLLDLSMPRMGGAQALPQLRSIQPRAKYVLISGYNEQQAVRDFDGGVDAFVKKPFGVDVLRVVLRKVLQA